MSQRSWGTDTALPPRALEDPGARAAYDRQLRAENGGRMPGLGAFNNGDGLVGPIRWGRVTLVQRAPFDAADDYPLSPQRGLGVPSPVSPFTSSSGTTALTLVSHKSLVRLVLMAPVQLIDIVPGCLG